MECLPLNHSFKGKVWGLSLNLFQTKNLHRWWLAIQPTLSKIVYMGWSPLNYSFKRKFDNGWLPLNLSFQREVYGWGGVCVWWTGMEGAGCLLTSISYAKTIWRSCHRLPQALSTDLSFRRDACYLTALFRGAVNLIYRTLNLKWKSMDAIYQHIFH